MMPLTQPLGQVMEASVVSVGQFLRPGWRVRPYHQAGAKTVQTLHAFRGVRNLRVV